MLLQALVGVQFLRSRTESRPFFVRLNTIRFQSSSQITPTIAGEFRQFRIMNSAGMMHNKGTLIKAREFQGYI